MVRIIIYCFLILLALGMGLQACTNAEVTRTFPFLRSSSPTTIIWACSGDTAPFHIGNNGTGYGEHSSTSQVPRLVLFRHHKLTDPERRKLHIQVSGIEIPPTGAVASLLVETQAEYPKAGSAQDEHIPVWTETTRIDAKGSTIPTDTTITFSHTFTETVPGIDGGRVETPSGYYHYQITVLDAADGTILYAFKQDYAFLIENHGTSEKLVLSIEPSAVD